MGKVLWHVTMSLDGFIAGPGDAMEWAFHYSHPNAAVDEVIRLTGAVLSGRRSFDVGRRPGQAPQAQKPYGGAWSGPLLVLTHRPPPDGVDPDITFLARDIRGAVELALRAARGKDIVVIGANVARQCIDEGLIDEIMVHLAPVLLGDGIRFFDRIGAAQVNLEATGIERAGQITNLRFRVRK
jgi:dihydrofolate reductase